MPLLVFVDNGRSIAVDYLLELGANIHAVDDVSYSVI